jgi:hypothetical protein
MSIRGAAPRRSWLGDGRQRDSTRLTRLRLRARRTIAFAAASRGGVVVGIPGSSPRQQERSVSKDEVTAATAFFRSLLCLIAKGGDLGR